MLPDVTVTPAAPPISSPASSIQKPFSVTVTNVPSPQASSKELSSFLQQSLEQAKIPKAPVVPPMKSYSHEAKVNKWLAEQASVDTRRRGVAPRLAPEEHVPVVHRVTGKRIAGPKAPQLKHLAQWIAENPMYDIDSKWTEGIKEHIKLPQDVRSQRHSPMQSSSGMNERKKGRPPTLDSPSPNVMSSNSHMNQNLAGLNPAILASLSSLSAFDPKTLAATLSNLTGFDPKLLNTFDPKLLSSLGSFDPKNNPLLNSFNSMPNLLGNIAGGNIFANLAGLGLPGFSSLDLNNLTGSSVSSESKSKSRKTTESVNPSSSKSSNSQFPFVFPNPNMLYPQLGLSGLNPFGMHSGMSSAYDALGLLSNNIAASSGASTLQGHSASRSTAKTTTPRSSTIVTNSSTSRQQKVSDRQQSSQLSQIHLPPDPYLLESLSKQSLNYESIMRPEKRPRDNDNHETIATDLSKTDKKKLPYDAMRSQVPPEFAAVQEKLLKGDKKDIDISKMLLEQMASGALSASLVSSAESKKGKDDKDIAEKLIKNSSEYVSRTLMSEEGALGTALAHKRSHEEVMNEPENLALSSTELNPTKKVKENSASEKKTSMEKQPDHSTHTGEMDLEDLIAPSTVIKTGMKPDFDTTVPKLTATEITTSTSSLGKDEKSAAKLPSSYPDDSAILNQDIASGEDCNAKIENEKDNCSNDDDTNNGDLSSHDGGRRCNKKKSRKSSEEMSSTCPRRELRSSSGRQSTESINANH